METPFSSAGFDAYAPTELQADKRNRSMRLRLFLMTALVVAIGIVAAVATTSAQRKAASVESNGLVAFRGLTSKDRQVASQRYRDLDGDLLADAPADALVWLNPSELVLAHYTGDDEGLLRVDWESLRKQLSERTRLPVRLQAYLHSGQELRAVAAGEIQLVAAHSAEIPALVNDAGLLPFAELSSPDGADGNRVVIATRHRTTKASLSELRGKTLVCTEPDSITGYRAAIVAIGLETGMQPTIDFQVYFSHKHERSMRGLANGKFQFVAISNDVLERMIRENRVRRSDIQIVFQSTVIPRLAIGHVHKLSPELSATIREMVLAFENQSATLRIGESYRFRAFNYKNDYGFIRRLDSAFSPRFGQIFSEAQF